MKISSGAMAQVTADLLKSFANDWAASQKLE